ncbi:MAG TPA: pectate lyase, partial [Cellvibrio sp.]|nr:pectate lyase [Cellvibrio sp.]
YQPPYSYNAMPTVDVKTHVTTYAGRNKITSCLNLPQVSSSSSSSSDSSSSSSAAPTALIAEEFNVDKTTLFSAAYKAISTDATAALYFVTGTNTGITIANNELTIAGARFSIGNRPPRTATVATDTSVNGDFDLSRPYKISFKVVAGSGTAGKKMQVYVDNNTSAAGSSLHGSGSKVWEAEAVSLTAGQVVEITPTIGTATSFIQLRTETGASTTIDDLKLEYLP